MSDIEEPPAKISKIGALDDTDDATDASLEDEALTNDINIPEETEGPEVANLPEVTSLPSSLPDIGLSEPTEIPQDLPEIDLPESKESLPELALPGIAGLPELTEVLDESVPNSVTEDVSKEIEGEVKHPAVENESQENESGEMVEERLQDSLGSQESQSQHEEWLSEGLLTDDDYNQLESSEVKNAHTNGTCNVKQAEDESKPVEQNIEDALNSLEGGLNTVDEFLVKKTDAKQNVSETKAENNKEIDDGNDTDDLLRMLGGDENKSKKKLTKTVKDLRNANKSKEHTSSDDEYEFEAASTKKVTFVKTLTKKLPIKILPEESDVTSDDAATLQKMFSKKTPLQQKPKIPANVTKRDKLATSTPLRPSLRSLLKPGVSNSVASVLVKKEPNPNTYSRVNKNNKKPAPLKTSSLVKVKKEVKVEPEEQEEYLEEEYRQEQEEHNTDEDMHLPKPELMDEEVPSDAESHSEDGSLYDELPSSDSEDIDDWFHLDIRAEKAGDYLPLLGMNAKEVLLEEKMRVTERLSNLKNSLSALTETGKKQAEQVRAATLTLAELDDMLKAS